MRDPISGADAGGQQRLSESARPLVQLRVRQRAVAAADRHDVGPTRPVLADDLGDSNLIQQLH